MDESSETIREQIEQTKSDLSEKLETLEQQVAESVQTTGAAVSGTVEAIRDTVQSVNGAVHHAVESVEGVFDIRGNVDRHPLLMVGGAALVGYVLADYFSGGTRKARKPPQPATCPVPSNSTWDLGSCSDAAPHDDSGSDGSGMAESFIGQQPDEARVQETPKSSAQETANRPSTWTQVGSMAAGVLLGLIQTAASHAVPRLIDRLLAGQTNGNQPHSNGRRPSPSRMKLPPEEGLQRHRANGPDQSRPHRRHD